MTQLRKPRVLIPVVGAVALLVVVLSVWQYHISVTNEGEALQERVEQTYESAQNSLSTCLDQGQTAAQVADQEFDRLKDILIDVASARYVDGQGNPTGASQALGGGVFFSAVFEAYPNISQQGFQNLQAVVVGCRDEYQGSQDRLFNEVREFETWIQVGNVFNQWIKNNFPTDSLDAEDYGTGDLLVGQPALEYMSRVIMVVEARDAYRDGELGEQDLFGDSG